MEEGGLDEGEEMYVTSMQSFNFMLTTQTLSSISAPVLLLNHCLFTFFFIEPLALYTKTLCKSKVWGKVWLVCECKPTSVYVCVLCLHECFVRFIKIQHPSYTLRQLMT